MNTRTKSFAVVLALVSAGAAALLIAGPASAAEWHVYKGDVYPGHAYGLMIPSGAESFEINLEGGADAAGSLAVYDPASAKVGHYELSSALTSASVASPASGRYVIYVYELAAGALTLRVNAEKAPEVLDLQKMPLVREDVAIGGSDAPAKLDKVVSANLKAPAVFLTLLYEGRAEAMDATVSSGKGVVMTIAGETGTAFAPGVYSSLSGSRRMNAANLEGTAYTVEVHAQSFEGTLVLTTLAVDFKAPEPAPPAPEAPKTPKAPGAVKPGAPGANWTASAAPVFAFEQGKAYAFVAKAGQLILADPMVEEATRDADEEEHEAHYSHYDVHGALSVYGPDDGLVAYVVLEHEEMTASVDLPVDGEYVVYVHEAKDEMVLAKLAGATAAPALRQVALVEASFTFDAQSFFGDGATEFVLPQAPVALRLEPDESVDLLPHVAIDNEDGTVAYYSALARTGSFDLFGWTMVDPANFRAGEHTVHVQGVMGTGITLTVVTFDRAAEAVEEVAVEEGEHHEESEEESDEDPWLPFLPATAPGLGLGL